MDVNALSTAGTKSSNSLSKLSGDFDMFLKLLTTQLQNQDPLDPMDNNEMTNQLVAFANVEQQISQNRNLEQMITLLNSQSAASAVAYIGKDVQFSDSTTIFNGSSITFGYKPAKSAESLEINVLDADGKIVRTLEGLKSAQRHTVVWDGLDKDGSRVPDGQYTFAVNALDASGKSIMTTNDVTGRATGSALDANGSYILVGDLAVDVTKILSVREPTAPS